MLSPQRRSLLLLTGIPLVTAIGGWAAASLVNSPEDVVRAEPTPSLITEEVVSTVLESAVVGRGDVVESESFPVNLTGEVWTGTEGSQTVYTGGIAQPGQEIAEGDLLAEISGRPVIALQGAIPMYRDLGPGAEGADVLQVETALESLGFFTDAPDEHFDGSTSEAVERLYSGIGYPAADSSASPEGGMDAAEMEVEAAQDALDAALAGRDAADTTPTEGEIMAAEAAVVAAQQRLDEAQAAGDEAATAQAEADVQLAREQLEALETPPDLSEHDDAVAEAREDLEEARDAQDALDASSGAMLPRGEVVAVPELPRQVGTVTAAVGQAPAGEALTLVGASTEVTMQVSRQEAELIQVGQSAELFEPSWGIDTTGEVLAVSTDAGAGGLATLRVLPDTDILEAIGANIRVSLPVGASDGEVLAVSVAAVYTDADGRTYVDKVVGGTAGAERTEPVEVMLGLVADALVEVRPVGSLQAGDQVAVTGQ